MKQRDEQFRKWYDSVVDPRNESFAYYVWCAAWEIAKKPDVCYCENIQRCTIFDKCMRNSND